MIELKKSERTVWGDFMDSECLKRQIAANIVYHRKKANLTQADLAQLLSYSDKAVSKWERAESMPDVVTLVQLAQALQVTLDQLTSDPDSPPAVEATPPPAPRTPKQLSYKRRIIAALSSILVWFIALLVYQILSDCGLRKSWIGFAIAVPVNAIVLLSLLSAWRYFRWNQVLISVIMWSTLGMLFLIFLVFIHRALPKLFLLGIPGQLVIFLWFRMIRKEDTP